MIKILLDTNVVLDYVLKRTPFFEDAKTIFSWTYNNKITTYISGSAITDIYYLIQQAKDKMTALSFLKDLLEFIQIAGIDNEIVVKALNSEISDFEDAIQNEAAEKVNVNYIVTRNSKDYRKSKLKIVSPSEFVKILK